VRAKLEARGRPVPADDRALARVLFEGGFSTRSEATAISGRGVGLDIVEAAVQRIRGSVDVSWREGRGTTFTLSAPLTLATVRALLVTVGRQVVAIPTAVIDRLLRLRPHEIHQIDGQHVISTPDGPIPLAALARLLGPPLAEKPATDHIYVVVLAVGRRRVAAAVDALLEEDELIVRPLERIGRPIPVLTGAALLPSGRVALVVNPTVLTGAATLRAAGQGITFAERAEAAPTRGRILVVDDSITTRTLEQSVLEAAGYDVLTATDGADAWRILQERSADLVITDVEMPRMDGFVLTETIRASQRFKSLPVVLVTSLETPEHRARGLEAGADAYIVKSSFDQAALLDTIKQLMR
jgi:two-component system chemotaxis sensor kinase CheA